MLLATQMVIVMEQEFRSDYHYINPYYVYGSVDNAKALIMEFYVCISYLSTCHFYFFSHCSFLLWITFQTHKEYSLNSNAKEITMILYSFWISFIVCFRCLSCFSISGYIDFWLDNIHCYCIEDQNIRSELNGDVERNPPVLIIGTGIDKIASVCVFMGFVFQHIYFLSRKDW